MKKLLLLTTIIIAGQEVVHAQALASKTGLRLYEHHSASISGPTGANGFQSGYDFVNRTYVNSFNAATFGPHTDGTDTTIDMVEHNGQYGNGQQFGFTSGVSSIWAGDIKGNGKTMWMEAPASFNYANVTDVNQLKTVYNAAQAAQSVTAVKNAVYIGRIRNSDLYVALRCYNVTNKSAGDTYFDFEYKYGVWNPNTTTVHDMEGAAAVEVYPNPVNTNATIRNILSGKLFVKIVAVTGQEIQTFTLNAGDRRSIDLSTAGSGWYFVVCSDESGRSFVQKLAKQ